MQSTHCKPCTTCTPSVADPVLSFTSLSPHKYLDLDYRDAFWRACELVRTRPDDFRDAQTWLETEYHHDTVLERWLTTSWKRYRNALRQLRHNGDPCSTFVRRLGLRAGRPGLSPEQRLCRLGRFAGRPKIGGLPQHLERDLIEHPERVRDWVVELSIQTAQTRGLTIRNGAVVENTQPGEASEVSEVNIQLLWDYQDKKCREEIRLRQEERVMRDEEHRRRAPDKVARLRQAVSDVLSDDLPAGDGELVKARRVVLLAAVLSDPEARGRRGEFWAWPWKTAGDPFEELLRGKPFQPGREVALFGPNTGEGPDSRSLSPEIELKRFADLLKRALSLGIGSAELGASASVDNPNNAVGGVEAGARWRDVQAKLEAKRKRGEPFTSGRKLAAELACSEGLVRKAIKMSASLRGWCARHRTATPRATGLAAVTLDDTHQTRGPDRGDEALRNDEAAYPEEEVEAALAKLIDRAEPDKRAQIHGMSDEGRRSLAVTYLEQKRDSEPSSLEPGRLRVRAYKRV